MAALKSKLGRANWNGVWGWALDADFPETKIEIEILVDDRVVGRVVADDPRPNLKVFSPDQRNCGFQFLFRNGLSAVSAHVIRARSVPNGRELHGSPVILEPATGFGPETEHTVAAALDAAAIGADDPAALDAPIAFVAEQIDRLVSARRQAAGGDAGLSPDLAALGQRWSELERLGAAASRPAQAEGTRRRALIIGDAATAGEAAPPLLAARIGSLLRLGLAVEFVAADYRPGATAQVAAFEAAGAVYHRPPLSPTVEDLLRRNRGFYDAILVVGIVNFEKYAALSRHYCPMARVIYDVDNLFFVRMLRRAGLQNWTVGIGKGEALRLREMMAAWGSHATITASAFEASLLRRGVPQGNIHVVAWPAIPQSPPNPFAERFGIGLSGDFRQHADLDAAAWLIEILMPAVRDIDPSVTCLIAGCNMPEALRTLVSDGVTILEQLPGDAAGGAAPFDRVRLTVALQRAGAGLAAAVLDSLAAGVPCIGTTVGLEALVLPESLQGCVTDDVPALAALACRLHADATANEALAEAGLQFVAEAFSPAAIDRQMLAVIGTEVSAEAGAPARR